jgi:hypothetical protein
MLQRKKQNSKVFLALRTNRRPAGRLEVTDYSDFYLPNRILAAFLRPMVWILDDFVNNICKERNGCNSRKILVSKTD